MVIWRASIVVALCACGARTDLGDGRVTPHDAGTEADASINTCTRLVLVDNAVADWISIDTDDVYFVSESLGIGRVPKTGGTVQSYASDPASWTVATDDDYVYWGLQTPNGFARAPKIGGAVETLASLKFPPTELVMDDAYVYFVNDTHIIGKAPKAGGAVEVLAQVDGWPNSIALDDGVLFVAGTSGVLRIDTSGANLFWLSHVGDGIGSMGANMIAVDAANVYWTSEDGHVRSVARDGTSLVTYAVGVQPCGLAIDDAFIYWVDLHDIYKSPKGVPSVTTLVQGDSHSLAPRMLAVDDQCLYAIFDQGAIVRFPK